MFLSVLFTIYLLGYTIRLIYGAFKDSNKIRPNSE